MRSLRGGFVAFLLFIGLSISAFGDNLCPSTTVKDWRPWPWSKIIAFPWLQVDGLWKTTENQCKTLFIFNVLRKDTVRNENIVEVIQYDPASCKVLNEGYGWESNRVITVLMSDGSRIIIRAFDSKDLNFLDMKTAPPGQYQENIILMTISTGKSWKDEGTNFLMEKLSKSKQPLCD